VAPSPSAYFKQVDGAPVEVIERRNHLQIELVGAHGCAQPSHLSDGIDVGHLEIAAHIGSGVVRVTSVEEAALSAKTSQLRTWMCDKNHYYAPLIARLNMRSNAFVTPILRLC
jgi:hypothetical protein